jgi:hypothetical protein
VAGVPAAAAFETRPAPTLSMLDRAFAAGLRHKMPWFMLWQLADDVRPQHAYLDGSWLILAEDVKRVVEPRAMDDEQPAGACGITARFDIVARHPNAVPTKFDRNSRRATRREVRWDRRHDVGGSRAPTRRRPIRRRS